MKGEEEDRGATGEKFLTVEVRGVTSKVIRGHCPGSWIFNLFSLLWQFFLSADPEKSDLLLSDVFHEEKSVPVLQFEVFQNIDELGFYQISVGFIPNKERFLFSKYIKVIN